MSEGELLDNVNNAPATTDQQHGSSTVISASHLTDVVSSPQRNYYMWKDHAGMQGKYFFKYHKGKLNFLNGYIFKRYSSIRTGQNRLLKLNPI